ncbi:MULTISPECIES: hypothetical protein [unclassified Streptomyces]|uniref:hypothetical protein n=1 Tax=unclassified Streptomyces TaxID=2593676 RepID=UPI0004AA722E|nr:MULTISPECIES: hypothetical protein [unclassified Streptomyces]APU38537.1 hypothetical protein BSL84_00840 [Streptomyces sp. TN58]APU43929.1 hypothetical protein BSL84_33660 [Streptomyces sp. TN58]KJK42938.1 hypothetical protein UK14_31275 [Streptomyces sp. NRRL F-4428]
MFRSTSRKQRFAMYAVSAAIVGGGVLVPTSAFAAPAAAGTTSVAAQAKSGHESDHKKEKWEKKDKKHDKGKKHQKHDKGKKHGKGKKNKVRDVENMPGCKFYQGKVYCEHKPDKPAPAPAPAPNTNPADKENPDKVPAKPNPAPPSAPKAAS